MIREHNDKATCWQSPYCWFWRHSRPAETPRVFHGEMSDSQCALNIHSLTRSHQEMLKSKSMGGTANTCAVYCIEHLGGYLVLSSRQRTFTDWTVLTWCTDSKAAAWS